MLQRRAEHHFDLVAPARNLLPSKLQLPAVNIFNAHGECDDNDDCDYNIIIIIFCGRDLAQHHLVMISTRMVTAAAAQFEQCGTKSNN